MLANTLKTTALAALLGLGVAGASATSASAYTIKTRCYGDDCVRMQCNNYGYDCFRIGYVDRDDYDRAHTRMIADFGGIARRVPLLDEKARARLRSRRRNQTLTATVVESI